MSKPFLRRAAPWLIFGAVALVVAVGLYAGAPSGAFLRTGDAAPATNLPVLNQPDARFNTVSWRGRPYVVNFFASWCADCKAEHEQLMTLAAGHVVLIGISFKDSADKTAAYLGRLGNPYAAVARDDKGRVAADWGLEGVPETFVVDAQGIIRWHYAGPLTDAVISDQLMPAWEAVYGDAR